MVGVLGGALEGWDVVCRFKTSNLQQIEQFVQVVPQTSPPTKVRKWTTLPWWDWKWQHLRVTGTSAKHPSSRANSTHLGVPEVLLYGTGCISCSDKGWAPVEVTTSESFRHLPDLCLGEVGSSYGLSVGGNLVKCVGLCTDEGVCVSGKAAAQYGAGVAGTRKSAWLWNPGTDLEVSWGRRWAVLCCWWYPHSVGCVSAPAQLGGHYRKINVVFSLLFLLHLDCGVAARTCAIACFVHWFQTQVSLWKSGRGGHRRHKGRKKILLVLFYAEMFSSSVS